MHHGTLSREIARGLRVLKDRIELENIPSSMLDERITIATWNIRHFGGGRRRKASIHFIAEIIGQFDVVAVIELRDNLRDLERVLAILGPYWRAVFSDFNRDAAGNRERIAYVYDTRAVEFTGFAAEADPPKKKNRTTGEWESTIEWWRSPFLASFRAGNFDFILMAAHIRWGSGESARIKPLETLADWLYQRRKEKYVTDKDIILLGDFNIPSTRSKSFKAITKRGLQIPAALRKKEFGTNLARNKRYDQILHYPAHESYFTNRGGVLDFYRGSHTPLIRGISKTKFTHELSDHIPLWIQVNVDRDEVLLDQVLNRRR